MGEAAYNLVTVTGPKEELERFEKAAYKNESEAFCLRNFLQYQGDSTAPNRAVFFTHWVAFGILIEKNENSLKYYFNSKWNAANLGFIVDRFPELDFLQVFVQITPEKVGYLHYRKDEGPVDCECIDYWENEFSPHQYLFIEDVALKLDYSLSQDQREFQGSHFFEHVDRTAYLRQYSKQYEKIVKKTIELERRDLFYARYGMSYTLHSHSSKEIARFIKAYILPERQDYLLRELNEQYIKISRERRWWNSLSRNWKEKLMDCLVESNKKYQLQKNAQNSERRQHVESLIQKEDIVIKNILKLKVLELSLPLIFDELEQTLNQFRLLNEITLNLDGHDYYFNQNGYIDLDELIQYIPQDQIPKVKSIILNCLGVNKMSCLSEFPNLGVFIAQYGYIRSLDGIEKSKNLKYFEADQGNYYSELEPLMELKLEYLNIQFAEVHDLTPLIFMPTLKTFIAGYCEVDDYHPLLLLPNLLFVELTKDFVIIEAKTNSAFKQKLKQFLIGKNIYSQQRLDELTDLQQYPEKMLLILQQSQNKIQEIDEEDDNFDGLDLPF